MRSTVHRWTIQCVIVVLSLVMACSTAWALSLGDAKGRGLVGEQLSGYLGAVSGKVSSDVQSLIDNVNQQRKQRSLKELFKSLQVTKGIEDKIEQLFQGPLF